MTRIAIVLLLAGCAAPPTMIGATHVVHVAMSVRDVDAASQWFTAHTNAEVEDAPAWAGGRALAIAIGSERVVLLDADAPAPAADSVPPTSNDTRFQHLALVVGDIDARWAALAGDMTPVSPAPQRIPDDNVAAAGIRAAYFRGPDGHPLELIAYPADKGRDQWHRTDDRVLGIDHTAIVVADTERSVGFYRDLLGLEIAGTSLNSGVEQERLSGVTRARVRITGLRGATGMGVELLEYETPVAVVSTPAPLPIEDPAHTHTTIAVDDLHAAIDRLRSAGVEHVSSPCIGCSATTDALLVADPDGHVVQLVQPRNGDHR